MTLPASICRALAAILTCAICAASWAETTPCSPFNLRVKRVDGTTVSGTVSGFDADGCEGAFGRVDWADMPAAEVNRALRRVLDLGKADQMVLLGRALMSAEDGETMGDSMLRQAVKRDAAVKDAADAARAQGRELRRMAAERRVRNALPQAREGSGVQAWPVATDEQRAAALAETKAEAEKALREVNARWTPVESEYWVVYADLTRGDAQELGQRMDNMYRRVAEMFALPKGLNLFHGKGVCIVSADENRFRAIEQAAFGMMPPPGCVGLCHMIGPRVLVNAWRSPDDDMFIATLVHEATHGIMHRYGTPVRLPMWAEEGYAEYVAANSFASSPVDRGRRDWGLKFIRDGNATAPYFEGDSAWPGPNAIGYSIGYMTVDLMIRKKDHLFGEWVKDVKTGVPWEQALKARFGMNAAELAAAVESFYRESERAE